MGESRLVNRNVNASVGRTSIRLEPELWDALEEICRRERRSMAETVQDVEARQIETGMTGGRTSAIRVHIVAYFRLAATGEGHSLAGHGAFDDA